jgi:indole-3-acetate monooxygenase
MQIRADTTLIEAAQRIAPVIREHNEEAERERRLSPPVLAALHEAGLLRMCTPRSLGGLEVDPITRAVVIEEISGYDSAAGWTLANPLDGHTSARGCRMRAPRKSTAAVQTS